MLMIEDILVSDDLISEYFACHLMTCRGACCFKGDYGAPLDADEMARLPAVYAEIRNTLPEESQLAISTQGLYCYYHENEEYGTTLLPDGRCVFMVSENGIASCAIERAWEAGLTDFQKPLSCHLYPVRVEKNQAVGFEALNYDRWEICTAACGHGKKKKIRLFEFVKSGLLRKYGQDFYQALEACARDLQVPPKSLI